MIFWTQTHGINVFIAEHSTMTNPKQSNLTELEAKKVLDAVRGLRFGSVEITVHEGRIVQVERKEKIRLNISIKDLENEVRPDITD